jgi:hypothetical protein
MSATDSTRHDDTKSNDESTNQSADHITETPTVRPSVFALPLLPRTPLEAEVETTGHARATIIPKSKDDIIDEPPHFFDDDNGGGGDGESCDFRLYECDADAKYWISARDANSPDGIRKTYYCPRHFALRLHNIINEVTHNTWFAEQKTVSQRRSAFQTYFVDWGEI